jgi:hypothetical protein
VGSVKPRSICIYSDEEKGPASKLGFTLYGSNVKERTLEQERGRGPLPHILHGLRFNCSSVMVTSVSRGVHVVISFKNAFIINKCFRDEHL